MNDILAAISDTYAQIAHREEQLRSQIGGSVYGALARTRVDVAMDIQELETSLAALNERLGHYK